MLTRVTAGQTKSRRPGRFLPGLPAAAVDTPRRYFQTIPSQLLHTGRNSAIHRATTRANAPSWRSFDPPRQLCDFRSIPGALTVMQSSIRRPGILCFGHTTVPTSWDNSGGAGSYLVDLRRLSRRCIDYPCVLIMQHKDHTAIIPHISQMEYDLNHIIPRISQHSQQSSAVRIVVDRFIRPSLGIRFGDPARLWYAAEPDGHPLLQPRPPRRDLAG